MGKGKRTAVSGKDTSDQYWISDYRRKELEAFCMQYDEFDVMRRTLEAQLYPLGGLRTVGITMEPNSYEDKMASLAEVSKAMSLIERPVYELDSIVGLYVLLHVVHGYTFRELCDRYGEVDKDIFDENVKKYFYILSIKKGL